MYDFLGQQAVPGLPPCYSAEFDTCIGEFEKNTPVEQLSPYCRQFHATYRATPGAVWDAAMESMSYCPAPAAAEKKKNFPLWLFGAGAAGLLLGTLIK